MVLGSVVPLILVLSQMVAWKYEKQYVAWLQFTYLTQFYSFYDQKRK